MNGGVRAAPFRRANAVPARMRLKTGDARAKERQPRDPLRLFSTFLLATPLIRALDVPARDRAPVADTVCRGLRDPESFKYVGAIVTIYTNVSHDPLALHAARVYLRWCDARPVARVDHVQAPPPP